MISAKTIAEYDKALLRFKATVDDPSFQAACAQLGFTVSSFLMAAGTAKAWQERAEHLTTRKAKKCPKRKTS